MFEQKPNKQNTLSIRLSTDGFSFSIHNSDQKEAATVIRKEIDPSLSMTVNLRRIFQHTDFPELSYKRVKVVLTTHRFTILPFELFEDELTEQLFHHNYTPVNNEKVCYNILSKNNAVVIFGMDNSVHTFLSERYPEAEFYAYATPLLEHFSIQSRLSPNTRMYAMLHPQAIDIYCLSQGKLLLCNSFGCTQSEDRLYYLLHTWKQLELEQEQDELHLIGTLTDKEWLTGELHKFIRHIFVMPSINQFEF